MSTPLRRRLRAAVPSAILAATVFVPLLLTRPGKVGADTKTYLYLDPGRMLARATSMWDPNIGMGTVTHQNIGYLWPIGPYYWLADAIGAPDWVAQRIWLGSILFLAGLGVRYMLKAMGQEGPHVTAATFVYALTPYVLTLGARLSVILLPYAGLPWLIGLTVLSLRHKRWREPALFALVVASIGSVNATALILCGVGPLLWIANELWITREVRFRQALAAVGRIGVLTVGCSIWWLSGLWAQGSYGIDILKYTETAKTVAGASVSLEVLRGLGYWFFYGEDRYGPWLAASRAYMDRADLVFVTYLLPGLGLLGAAFTRFRERAFFLVMLVVGLFLAVGAHPWDGGAAAPAAVKAFLLSDAGLAMRSLPRAAPLVVLSLSVFAGSLVAAITVERPRLARPLTAGVMVLAVLALPPLWRGQMVDANLDRDEHLPEYWNQAAAALDRRDDGTRVLEVPGSDFASYRWGNTVDPVLPGLMDRPYVARELIPYGSPPSADLLNAVDHRLQEQTFDAAALAPMARFMGVGDISVRSDLSYERYNTPRPRPLWELLRKAPGIGTYLGFGPGDRNTPRASLPLLDEQELQIPTDLPDPPEVGILPVEDAEKIIRTAPVDEPVVLAGNGDGLVDAASVGLVDGHELVLYSGSYAGDEASLRREIDRDAALVLTDTNRREGRRWSTVRDNTGITERAGQEPLVEDPTDERLEVFPDATDRQATITEARGGVYADATGYGNSVSLTAEDDPANAVDGNPNTAWRVGGFSDAVGEAIRLTYREPVTTDHLRVLQAFGGVRNRFITKVDVSFDGGPATSYDLDGTSRPEQVREGSAPGQILRFGERSFSTVKITIRATDPGNRRTWDGVSATGFAEIVAVDRDGTRPVGDDVVRLPTDLLAAAGRDSIDHPLAVVLTRQRVAGTAAVRTDPELSMARAVELPAGRDFALSGQVRLSNGSAADSVIDKALGLPDAEDGGVTATSSRHIPGGLANRAMAAIDGDPDTWWSPGFLDQRREFVDYRTAQPVTVDRFELSVLDDGRHSVPQKLDVTVGSGSGPETTQEVTLEPIPDQSEPNGHHTFSVRLPKPVTGTHVRVAVGASERALREVTTLDWFTGRPVILPIGIVDLGIAGLDAPDTPEQLDPACRTDLLEIDGKPVGVSLRGATADLLAGKPASVTTCDTDGVSLSTGKRTLRTTAGAFTGLDLDRLVLRSAAGGAADATSTPITTGSTPGKGRPAIQVDHQDRTSMDLTVTGADDDFWLVLGQSHNLGWTATAEGKDLGEPTLVDGYANGWQVPAGQTISVHLEWTPQKVVWGSLAASAVAVLVALALALWPRRRAAGAESELGWIPLDSRPSMPRALRLSRILRYAGPSPSRFALLATVAGALVLGGAVIGPLYGVALAAVALLALRVPQSRPLLTLGGPLLFAGSVAVLGLDALRFRLPPGFDWPTYFESIHRPGLAAIALLALDVVVDRCWLRRWWPTEDSPT
ncbi:alpha-(1-_3)-arabinofuranosyltransferase [soil metagenome]